MGEVYLADDLRLGRKVALKLLPPQATLDTDRVKRFQQEARAASALNHPNIVTILEIGKTDSLHFIATEFVDGETLRDHMTKTPMTVGEVLDIAAQVASALQAAHSAGIVHRDIKPENIMLRRDGLVKVLDFGLAKLAPQESLEADDEQSTAIMVHTNPGIVMGTVAYMSPEQGRGTEVDARTDIWSLGVVLYEMVAGRTPFEGETSSHVIVSILEREPPPLAHGPERPDELRRIILKALDKNKATRYQSASALADDLKSLKEKLKLEALLNRVLDPMAIAPESSARRGTSDNAATRTNDVATNRTRGEKILHKIKRQKGLVVAAILTLSIGLVALWYLGINRNKSALSATGKKSIAVLPVKPINQANRDEVYEIGIPDSLISKLATTNGLVVSSLDSIRKYADVGQDPVAAGKEQHVDYVLASNYQLVGGELKFTGQLINVSTGQIEDTYKFEKETSDVFALQDAIAVDVGNKLFARFATSASRQVTTRGTTNAEAYRLYLQGKNLVAQRNSETAQRAIAYFEQAIQLDPSFAKAYAGIANAYHSIGLRAPDRHSNDLKAKESIKKALEIDGNCADAYAARGIVGFSYDWDFTSAEKDLITAIQLEPNNDNAHWGYALLSAYNGQFEKATTEIETALIIAPGTAMYERDRGRVLYLSRRYDEAVVQLKRAIELKQDLQSSWASLLRAQEMKGDYAGAYDSFVKWATLTKTYALESFQTAYANEGWLGVRRKSIQHAQLNNTPPTMYYDLAAQSVRVGEKELAFEYLNKALERRSWEIALLRVDPQLDPLRSDPRFDQLVKRIGYK
jgi:serine/threonine-protein kinase